MEYSKITELRKINFKTAEFEIANAIRGFCRTDQYFSSVISVAYILILISRHEKEFETTSDIIKSKVPDEATQFFLLDSLKRFGNIIFDFRGKHDANTLLSIILFSREISGNSGDFDTPESINRLAISLLDIKEKDNVIDLCSGVGTFLISAYEKQPEALYFGREINVNSKVISSIRNMAIGSKFEIKQGDVFEKEDGIRKKYEKVFSNYPIGMKLNHMSFGQAFVNEENDKYFDVLKGITADWVFNLLLTESITESGRAIGIMSNSGTWNSMDKKTREYFVKNGLIEIVISLPDRIFDYTGIPSTLIVFSKGNKTIKMVDARNLCQKGRRQNVISDENVKKILEACKRPTKVSKVVEIEEIEKDDFILQPMRYFDQGIEIENGVEFDSLFLSIKRGAGLSASELDDMVSKEPTDLQYLMLGNISDGRIDDELPYLKCIDKKLNKYCIKNNSLILSKNGYPFKVAVASVQEGKTILGSGNMYIIELDENKVHPYYVKAFLESEMGIATLKSIVVGAAIANISISNISKIKIPLIDLRKQKIIADKYLAALDEIDILKRKLLKVSNSLKSILDESTAEDK